MFEEIFTQLHKKNNQIKAIGVWGKDGLELEKKYFSQMEDIEIDLDFSGAEIADILARLDRIKTSPHTFSLKLAMKKHFLLIISLTSDYFLMILAEPDLIEGKLNFYLNLYKNKLSASL